MTHIAAGDHVGTSFASADQFAVVTAAFARQGLALGARVMIFPGERTSEALARELEVDELLSSAIHEGRVLLGDVRTAQLAHGRFDRDYLHLLYAGATAQSVATGFTGLWVSVDMSWAPPWFVDADTLTAFEAGSHTLFASRRLTAICHYDEAIFPRDQVWAACAAHPAGLHGVAVRRRNDGALIRLSGVADLSNAIAFRALSTGFRRGGTVDLSEMSFIDISALTALARAGTTADVSYVATPHQHEMLKLIGVADDRFRAVVD
jgi:hypothetical protein